VNQTQTTNLRRVLWAVHEYGANQGWSVVQQRYCAYLSVQCVLTESNGYVLANPHVPESMNLPHDGLGSDHASVGLFQQQVPMWGTAHDCMDPRLSTRKFLNALVHKTTIAPTRHPASWTRIQAVQVSAFADGRNYRANALRAMLFLNLQWLRGAKAPRVAVSG